MLKTDLATTLAYQNADVTARFAEDFHVSPADAEEIFTECKRWLWISAKRKVELERGIGESFTRSGALTKGRRWQVFAVILIALVIQVAFGAAVGFVVGVVAYMATGGEPGGLGWTMAIVELLAGSFAAVLATVGYYFLRAEKEGIVIDDIARVFD